MIESALSSPTALVFALASGAILFALMMRELVLWFFGITRIEKQLTAIQESVARLEARSTVQSTTPGASSTPTATATSAATPTKSPLDTVEPPPSKSSNFPLQH